MRRVYLILAAVWITFFSNSRCYSGDWAELKDEHFVVYYSIDENASWARQVLRKAEEYYDKIASQIGYSRYSNFWTWEERAKIIIFKDQLSYLEKTGQPQWSTGYSSRDSRLFKSRVIVTYSQEQDFLSGLLPHEISHLILRDFVGFDRKIPIWFDEGLAQFNEVDKKNKANNLIKKLVKQNQFIPFSFLNDWDIRQETDTKKVALFYTQSVTIIDFLVQKYGAQAFRNLCWNFREGKSIEDAIHSAYLGSIDSLSTLEAKWLKYMKK